MCAELKHYVAKKKTFVTDDIKILMNEKTYGVLQTDWAPCVNTQKIYKKQITQQKSHTIKSQTLLHCYYSKCAGTGCSNLQLALT
jgi:hypothetical protein